MTFIKRVYADWLGHGLTRAHLRDLDLPLYNALATWTRRHGPGDLDLPTKKELNDRLLAGGSFERPDLDKAARERLRLYNAARYRAGLKHS